jgi:hypothetical protein
LVARSIPRKRITLRQSDNLPNSIPGTNSKNLPNHPTQFATLEIDQPPPRRTETQKATVAVAFSFPLIAFCAGRFSADRLRAIP